MSEDITDQFFDFLTTHKISVKDAANDLGKRIQTVYNWRSKGVPGSQTLVCQAYMEKMAPSSKLTHAIVMEPSREQYKQWNQSALDAGLLVEVWAMKGLDALADKMPINPKETPLSKKMGVARRTNGNGNGNGESKTAS